MYLENGYVCPKIISRIERRNILQSSSQEFLHCCNRTLKLETSVGYLSQVVGHPLSRVAHLLRSLRAATRCTDCKGARTCPRFQEVCKAFDSQRHSLFSCGAENINRIVLHVLTLSRSYELKIVLY
jgi:hypothetical protein